MPPALAQRPASALWVLVAALGALYGALAPSLPFREDGGATRLERASFHPDEAVLQSAAVSPQLEQAEPARPSGVVPEAIDGTALRLDVSMRWNGHVDRRWSLPDGREFVLSPWGGTWWDEDGQRRRAEVDLPGHDPSLAVERLDAHRLLVERHTGGYWLIDLSGAQAQVEARLMHPGRAS